MCVCPHRAAATRLLTAHAEPALMALASRNAAALAGLALRGTRSALQVVEREHARVYRVCWLATLVHL
jgi:hypothetical protein